MVDAAKREELIRRMIFLMKQSTAAERQKLIDAMGVPPDPRRVSESVWKELEQSFTRATRAAMLISWYSGYTGLRSATEKVTLSGDEDRLIANLAQAFADREGTRLAQQMVDATKNRVFGMLAGFYTSIEHPEESAPTEAAKKKAHAHAGPRVITTAREVEREAKRAVKEQLSAKRFAAAAVGETGRSIVAGQRYAREIYNRENPDKVLIAVWRHTAPRMSGRHPCPEICAPLIGRPETEWAMIHPHLPEIVNGPPAHVHCDCVLQWIAMDRDKAAQLRNGTYRFSPTGRRIEAPIPLRTQVNA